MTGVGKLSANDASVTITTGRSFTEFVTRSTSDRDSLVCVGLDPDLSRMPESIVSGRSAGEAIVEFNKRIIDATAEYAAAYKPQFAMYVQYGPEGYEALLRTRELIPGDTPAILDCKIGDIASTMEPYARAYFDEVHFDAITANPYMGSDSLAPVFDRPGKGVFVLCKTSNPGSGEIQNLDLAGGQPLFVEIASKVLEWNASAAATLGLVVGATYPAELQRVREVAPNLLLLIPGIGSQAGDLAASLDAGLDANGAGVLINSSRGIIYASEGDDFDTAAGKAARRLRDQINAVRN
ncbi:MAG: orotidine-5'-phosphate decarboxylase [Thermomicrobiales bacterium]|nr:orotidine-5'-phosphate decarboxylase [Thermomicrobiales bacterium]